MTKLALRHILAAALLLFIPLYATTADAANVKGALKLVPRDAFAVGMANVDTIKKSQIFIKAKALLLKDKAAKANLAKLKRETGIDLFRHLRSLTVALGPDIEQDDDQWVVIAEGKVNKKKLLAFMRKEGANLVQETGPHGKYHVIDNQGAIAFRGNFVLLGGTDMVKQALRKQGPSKALKAALAKYAKRDIFAAAKPTAKMNKELRREHKDLGGVKIAAAGLNLRRGIDFDAFGKLASAAAAKNIVNMVNAVLAEGMKDQTVQQLGLDTYIAKLKIAAVGAKLTGSLKLTSKDVKSLLKMLAQMM